MPTLKVFVNEANNLFGADLNGKSDPYCVLKIGEGNQFSSIEKTRKISNTKNPQWKECFTLNVNNPLTECLFLEVWNKETMSKDDNLGTATVQLNDLQRGVEKQVWVQLQGGAQGGNIIGKIAHLGKKKEERANEGKVFLGLTALDFGIDPSIAQQQFGGAQGLQHGQQQGMQPGMQQGMQQGMQPNIQQGQQGMQQPGMQQGQHGVQQPGIQSGQHGQQFGQQGMQQPGMQQGQPGMQQGQPGMQQPGIQSGQQPGIQSGGQQGFSGQGMQGSQIPSTTTPISSSTHPPVPPPAPHSQQKSAYPQDL